MITKPLESDRLFLRPLSLEELEYLNNDDAKKIAPTLEKDALTDSVKIAVAKKILKMHDVSPEVHEWFTYWIIVNKHDGKAVGFIGFKGIPDEAGYAEVGYSISYHYRRQGLMTEALSLLLNWASGFPGCKGITARKVLKTNIGSNRVLANCNFQLMGSEDAYNNYLIEF